MGREKQSGRRVRGWPRAGLTPEGLRGRCEQRWGGRETSAGHQGMFSFQRCRDPGDAAPTWGDVPLPPGQGTELGRGRPRGEGEHEAGPDLMSCVQTSTSVKT